MKVHQVTLPALLLLAITTADASPTPRIAVSDLKPLLKLAIDQGEARGTLVGEPAALVRNRFGASSPIEIDVRAIQALHEPGCSRLEVTTRQAGIVEKGGTEDLRLTYQLNYCRDGRIPGGS